jgi:hypothetical protein
MPSKQLTDPLGQSGEVFDYGNDFIYVQFNPAGSGVIASGNVVEVVQTTLASTTAQMLCQLTTSTGNFTFLGVAVDAPAGGYLPGQVVKIATSGKVSVLFDDNSTTFGHLAIQSAATAGQATDSATATLGKTLGFILETVTISAAGTLVPVWLRIM